jgi:TonB family protein
VVWLVLFVASNGVLAAAPPLVEELPPIGKGQVLSEEQIAYCLAQGIRVEAMRTLVNRYRREQVDFFNAVVAGFNARCQSYRYEGDARDNAKAQVETHRAQIEADARDSYVKRFSVKEKEPEKVAEPVSSSTAPTSVAATPNSPPPTSSTREPKPTAVAPAAAAPTAVPGSAATPLSSAAAKPAPDVAAGISSTPPATDTAAAVKPSPSVSATIPTTPAPTVSSPAAGSNVVKPPSTPDGTATSRSKPGATPTSTSAKADSSVSVVTPSTSSTATTPPKSEAQKSETQPGGAPSAPVAATAPPKAETQPAAAPAPVSEPRTSATARTPTAEPTPSSSRPTKSEPSLANAQPPVSYKPATPAKTKAEIDAEAALDRFSREIRHAGSQVVADSSVPAAADKGATQIDVRYASGGYIKSIDVGQSSGYAALDERALDIARNIRFPNVPQELQSRDFVLRFPIVFRSTAGR